MTYIAVDEELNDDTTKEKDEFVQVLDWDAILAVHGESSKTEIESLLESYGIDKQSVEAALIASMFLAHNETLKAFVALESVLEDNRKHLSGQFTEQILALRGIVSYAREHLTETTADTMKSRHEEMLEVVSRGIKKAISKSSGESHTRNLASTLILVGLVGTLTIASSAFTYMLSSRSNPSSVTEKDVVWDKIREKNSSIVEDCYENIDELEGKCRIFLEQP